MLQILFSLLRCKDMDILFLLQALFEFFLFLFFVY